MMREVCWTQQRKESQSKRNEPKPTQLSLIPSSHPGRPQLSILATPAAPHLLSQIDCKPRVSAAARSARILAVTTWRTRGRPHLPGRSWGHRFLCSFLAAERPRYCCSDQGVVGCLRSPHLISFVSKKLVFCLLLYSDHQGPSALLCSALLQEKKNKSLDLEDPEEKQGRMDGWRPPQLQEEQGRYRSSTAAPSHPSSRRHPLPSFCLYVLDGFTPSSGALPTDAIIFWVWFCCHIVRGDRIRFGDRTNTRNMGTGWF